MFGKFVLSLFTAAALTTASNATISVILQADLLTDANGTPLPQSGLVLLIASTSNSVFESISPNSSTAVGSALAPGGDDYIVYRTTLAGYGVNGVLDKAINNGTGGALDLSGIPGWSTGDPLALMWFPTLDSESSLLSAGTSYGFYSNPLATDGSGAWTTPADPSNNYKLYFFTKNGGELSPGVIATNEATAGRASLTIPVPEPTSVGLFALGILTAIIKLRRRSEF